jgi:hypothetical protein
MPARLMAPRTAVAPRSVALTALSTPPSEPTGVRAPETIKISWGVKEADCNARTRQSSQRSASGPRRGVKLWHRKSSSSTC